MKPEKLVICRDKVGRLFLVILCKSFEKNYCEMGPEEFHTKYEGPDIDFLHS